MRGVRVADLPRYGCFSSTLITRSSDSPTFSTECGESGPGHMAASVGAFPAGTLVMLFSRSQKRPAFNPKTCDGARPREPQVAFWETSPRCGSVRRPAPTPFPGRFRPAALQRLGDKPGKWPRQFSVTPFFVLDP